MLQNSRDYFPNSLPYVNSQQSRQVLNTTLLVIGDEVVFKGEEVIRNRFEATWPNSAVKFMQKLPEEGEPNPFFTTVFVLSPTEARWCGLTDSL